METLAARRMEGAPAEYLLPAVRPTLGEAQAWCRRLATTHYENFHVATWFLPRRARPYFESIYAFSRAADDLGDEVTDRAVATRLLGEWREMLEECYERPGDSLSPVFVALRQTIEETGVPRGLFDDLIKAFEMDQEKTRFASLAELEEYSRLSANPAGRLVLWVSGYRDEERGALSDKVCTALQLANFWQDVVEDWERGRRYLPGDAMARVWGDGGGRGGAAVYSGVWGDDGVSGGVYAGDAGGGGANCGDGRSRVGGDAAPVRRGRAGGAGGGGGAGVRRAGAAAFGVERGEGEVCWRGRWWGSWRDCLRAGKIADDARERGRGLRVLQGRGEAEAKNFYYAFRVLPRAKSDAMCAVYAFMRRADDLADDERVSLEMRRESMAGWLEEWRTGRRGGEVRDSVFLALGDAQRRFAISDELLEELVRGTTMDLHPGGEPGEVAGSVRLAGGLQGYQTFADLYGYCYLVASVVGLVCIRIFGYKDAAAELLAERTGVAFQLTNILRDVKEDAERGRIYLPQEMLREFGVGNEDVLALAGGRALRANERAMLEALSGRAWGYYAAAQELLPLIDEDSRAALWVLVEIYSGLLGEIDAMRGDVFSQRARVSTGREGLDAGAGCGDGAGSAAGMIRDGMGMSGQDVVVVGAGLAGLAAAVALVEDGARVTVLERRPEIGGRAYSYLHPALEETVDSQHVMLGCCTNLLELCEQAGTAGKIRWYDELTFLEPNGSRSVMRAGRVPAPGHQAMSFLRAPMLSLADKAGIARGMLEFLRGYPADDAESFATWLGRTKQTERAIRHFWEPVVVGALNDTFARCSTKYAGKVFHESFLRSAEGGRLGIPAEPLTDSLRRWRSWRGRRGCGSS